MAIRNTSLVSFTETRELLIIEHTVLKEVKFETHIHRMSLIVTEPAA